MDDTTPDAPETPVTPEVPEVPEPKAPKASKKGDKASKAPVTPEVPARAPGSAVRVIVGRARVPGPDRRHLSVRRSDIYTGEVADYLVERFPELVEPFPKA